MASLLSKILISSGIVIVIVASVLLWKRNDPNRLQFDSKDIPDTAGATQLAEPVGLIIESLRLKLPIIPATKKGEMWETTASGVSYLTLSPRPGESGNSILYGHNWGSILGSLHSIRPGQIIEIYYSDGTVREFVVLSLSEISPQDISVLDASDDSRVTLYTCSGFFDQKRLVVIAVLV